MLRLLISSLCLLTLSACSQVQNFSYKQPPVPINMAGKSLMAGVASRDITPPPGLPRAGYSLASTTGEGFRTRLLARAYYMKDKQGQAYAMIQTDLMAGSRILLARVADLVADKTGINAGNLTITATHTHSSPGQYLGSEFYNKHASHKAGFDPEYFEFLARQMADALIEAHDSRVPAKIATGKKAVWGLTRNRSIHPFSQNENHQAISATESEVFHAINPYLYMVRIDGLTAKGSYEPLGAFMSFSIHGTSIPRWDPLFNGDLWSYFQGDLKQKIEQELTPSKPVVIGGFEGTHGDMAPAMPYKQSGYIWSRHVGSALAKEAWTLYETLTDKLDNDVSIKVASRHINMRQQPEINGVSICDEAAAGTTLTAGPFEHEIPVLAWLPIFKQGSKRWFFTDSCQGNKLHVGTSWLQPLFEPKDSFPNDILFQVIQVGNLVIAPLPFELTAETGFRIERAIKASYADAAQPTPDVMVSSLANGYTGYITTPEEYAEQFYEGGHTIYGRYSQPYVTQHLELLSKDLLTQGQIQELPDHWNFNLPVRKFVEPADKPAGTVRKSLSSPSLTLSAVNQEAYWAFEWQDVPTAYIELHKPLLSIETSSDKKNWEILEKDGLKVDDQGYDLAIQMQDSDSEKAEYKAYWYNPVFKGPGVWYRFVIQARGEDKILYSPAFH